MTLSVFLFSIFVLAVGYLLIAGLIDLRASRRLREISLRQKTQREFGKLRHELMGMLADKEISGRSLIFLHLYLLNTTVMRQPEGHRSLASKLLNLFDEGIKRDEPVFAALVNERSQWSPATHGLVAQHSVELTLLMIRHSTAIRIAYMIAKMAGRTLFKSRPPFLTAVLECIDKVVGLFSPTTRAMVRARNEMAELAV
jgi:hypothetical protein